MFNPNSPQAQAIADLFRWSMVVGSAIFALVTGLVIYVQITISILKGRRNMPAYGNTISPEDLNALVAFLQSRTQQPTETGTTNAAQNP